MLKNEHYEIFTDCFPQLTLTKQQLEKLADIKDCSILESVSDGIITGFAAVYKNCIRLLCVKTLYRCQGAGSSLLEGCEEKIKAAGFNKVIIGGMDSELFLGAVTSEEEYEQGENSFFHKRGYTANDGCVEMKLSLENYDSAKQGIQKNEYLSFGFYDGDKSSLLKVVAEVEKDWVQYFNDTDTVFAVYHKGRLAGFCLLDYDCECVLSGEGIKVGSVGCVGVLPQFRKQGAGLSMVNEATAKLREHGCDLSFIHYTHLENWYGKLGYKTFLRYRFGHKNI